MKLTMLCVGIAALGVALAQAPQPTAATAAPVPVDAGMYVVTANSFTKILGQAVTFTRTGSLLVSSATVGIKARKQNIQLPGPHAQTVTENKPTFYFIPAKLEADAGVNASDLILIRLEEKPERRQFEVGAQGLWRARPEISLNRQVQLFRSEEKPGVYKITPAAALDKGEYALYLQKGHETSAYVYDFSVSVEQTIILDRGWNHDYATNWCKMPVHYCMPADAELEIASFESNFATAFAIDSKCSGIRLLGVREEIPAHAIATDHWSLSFDFIPGQNQQGWHMLYGTDEKQSAQGEGSAESVARSVCAFINHTGGSVD